MGVNCEIIVESPPLPQTGLKRLELRRAFAALGSAADETSTLQKKYKFNVHNLVQVTAFRERVRSAAGRPQSGAPSGTKMQ